MTEQEVSEALTGVLRRPPGKLGHSVIIAAWIQYVVLIPATKDSNVLLSHQNSGELRLGVAPQPLTNTENSGNRFGGPKSGRPSSHTSHVIPATRKGMQMYA